jgi:enterobactin synthetase component D
VLEIIDSILSPMEKEMLAVRPLGFASDAIAVFSAKETLFKMLYPFVKRFFGFHSAQLRSPPAPGSLTLRLTEDLSAECTKGTEYTISVRSLEDFTLTYGMT